MIERRPRVVSWLLAPLSTLVLNVVAGLAEGVLWYRVGVLPAVGALLAAAVVVALLDLGANLRASWQSALLGGEAAARLRDLFRELLLANATLMGIVAGLTYLALRLLV